jgi:hypothetical protein
MFLFCFGSTILIGTGLFSQAIVDVAGGQASGPSGKLDYSIGQTVYANFSSSAGNLNEGVQQTYEIIILSNESLDDGDQVTVYPNPASESVVVKLKDAVDADRYELLNANGKVIQTEKITATETTLNIQNYSEPLFFLRVYDHTKKCKTFKLIKVNKP